MTQFSKESTKISCFYMHFYNNWQFTPMNVCCMQKIFSPFPLESWKSPPMTGIAPPFLPLLLTTPQWETLSSFSLLSYVFRNSILGSFIFSPSLVFPWISSSSLSEIQSFILTCLVWSASLCSGISKNHISIQFLIIHFLYPLFVRSLW